MTETPAGYRELVPLMRVALYVGSFLVFLAGIQLFVLTTRTDHYFAWTIANPLTAAFLGAFYWTAIPLLLDRNPPRVPECPAARVGQRPRRRAGRPRAGDGGPGAPGPGAGDRSLAPSDPARLVSLRLVAQALLTLTVGVILFAAPTWAAGWWPWALTPLTSRAMASWLLGLGVVLATALLENDWVRIRAAPAAYAVLGILQLVALARYGDRVSWAEPAAWVYLAFVASVLFAGAYGWFRAAAAFSVVQARA